MRSAAHPASHPPPESEPAGDPDRTARARIRDAAIALFSREGFGVSVRRVAAAAEVSPALVIHHFGSKDGLKDVCDQRIGQLMEGIKAATMAAPPDAAEANLLYQLAHADSYGYLLGYLLHAVSAGGAAASRFVGTMVEASERLLRRGVAAGAIRPSRDPAALARYLTYSGIGALIVWQAAQAPHQRQAAPQRVSDFLDALTLPTLELCTNGLFTNSALLDAYLAHASGPQSNTEPDKEPTTQEPPNDQDN
ncbi:MAG: TetR family transcriptional regulator [Bifidobacteriaceae bacterium]|jgi:AcrR family transcriptional regulator|nr:TetR family transcriptional regulator [Bifidobacteriaceae bacterium]